MISCSRVGELVALVTWAAASASALPYIRPPFATTDHRTGEEPAALLGRSPRQKAAFVAATSSTAAGLVADERPFAPRRLLPAQAVGHDDDDVFGPARKLGGREPAPGGARKPGSGSRSSSPTPKSSGTDRTPHDPVGIRLGKRNGGFILITLSSGAVRGPSCARRRRRLRAAGARSAGSRTNSIPRKSPRPRNPRRSGAVPSAGRGVLQEVRPPSGAAPGAALPRSRRSTARPISQDTDCRRSVKYSMAVAKAAAISGVVRTAARGWPLPRVFPSVDDVGHHALCLEAQNVFPTRPNPTCTRRHADRAGRARVAVGGGQVAGRQPI